MAFAITLNPGITLMVSYDANHFLWFQVNSYNAKFLVNFGRFYCIFKVSVMGRGVLHMVQSLPPPFHSLLLFNCQQLRQLPMIQRQKRCHHESSHVH